MNTTTDYQKQATDFLQATGTTFECEFLRHGKHFADDTESRDIYKITLKRGRRSYSFDFGQSLNNSGEYHVVEHLRNKVWCKETTGGKIRLNAKEFEKLKYIRGIEKDIVRNPNYKAPTPYDVLACLTKYDPGTFEDFCSEFGYDTDSKKAEKTYLAVKDEWQNVCALFADAEIEQLQEIN